ncbi:MAG: restriction endonuclease subunit S [Acholeplasma sp.]|nr:restriction endonuclease subunit S [Acholeplasma sp.]
MKTYRIKDLATEISIRENVPKESKYDKFVGLEHYISGEMHIKQYGESSKMSSSAKIFKSGDVLIARRNVYLRRAGIVDFDGLTSGDSIVLRAKNSTYKKILPFILNTQKFWSYATKHADGTMSKRLSPKLLMDFKIILPKNLEDIDKLSDLLLSITITLDSYRDMVIKLDQLVESKFDAIINEGFEKKLNLEEISINWSKGQRFKKEDIIEDGSHKCIHYGELFTTYGPRILNVISRTNIDPIKVSKTGDILFPASDVTPDGLARCSVIEEDGVILGGDIIIMTPKEEFNKIYLSYAINFEKQQLLSRVTGSVVKHLSSTSLKSIKIPIVSSENQNIFSNFVVKAEILKNYYYDNIERLNDLLIKLIVVNLEKEE